MADVVSKTILARHIGLRIFSNIATFPTLFLACLGALGTLSDITLELRRASIGVVLWLYAAPGPCFLSLGNMHSWLVIRMTRPRFAPHRSLMCFIAFNVLYAAIVSFRAAHCSSLPRLLSCARHPLSLRHVEWVRINSVVQSILTFSLHCLAKSVP